jgi:hypothetical protein
MIIRDMWYIQNQDNNMHARVHPNHMPEETMGRENIPAPIAPPVMIAIPPNIELIFVLFSASSIVFID